MLIAMPSVIEDERRRAAEAAAQLVEPRMVVGLGTGRTAAYAVRALAERMRAGLRFAGVPTSEDTARLATELGIPLRKPDDVPRIDLTIDGADEIDPSLRLIKGAGGALTRERMVARASLRLAIVADSEKRVTRLGERMRLPVEILPFAHAWTVRRLADLGLDPAPRMREGAWVTTDNGGLLVDCGLAAGANLAGLDVALNSIAGVIDHGLFLTEATVAYVGVGHGVDVLTRPGGTSSTPAP